jgi:hypothetical protein
MMAYTNRLFSTTAPMNEESTGFGARKRDWSDGAFAASCTQAFQQSETVDVLGYQIVETERALH